MKEIKIERHEGVDITFSAPPSKSFTHRALFCAALADGRSVIEGPLVSGDTLVTCSVLGKLGIRTEKTEDGVAVRGCGGYIPDSGEVVIDCEGSGTTLRFLTSLSLLYPKTVTLTGNSRMKERPVGELAAALSQLGGRIEFPENKGFPPLRISGSLAGGRAVLDASKSSQFVSSILIPAPYAKSPVEVTPTGKTTSKSYIDITIEVMKGFGAVVDRITDGGFRVPAGKYSPARYRVEGDYSSASYLFAVAAVCGGRVTVTNLNPASVQGDRAFLVALSDMGCTVVNGDGRITVERDGFLDGIETDMSSSPDTVQTLAAVAVFARTPTVISGISHLRYKESDRIDAIGRMVRDCGAKFECRDDMIRIIPGRIHGFVLEPEDDHRTAMAGAIIGFGTGGVTIRDPDCVAKSYPGFWKDLREAGLCRG